MEWRNWYGVRRKQSDLAEDVETDARVLNRLGAWTHTATREHYQEQGATGDPREGSPDEAQDRVTTIRRRHAMTARVTPLSYPQSLERGNKFSQLYLR